MGLPVAALFGVASGIAGVFKGEPAKVKEARNLLGRASARPLEIPTLAANRTVTGKDNYSVDETGNPVSKTPAVAARDIVRDRPEFQPVAIPGRKVKVSRSAFGASAGATVQVYQTKAAADEGARLQAEIDQANARVAAQAASAAASGRGFEAIFGPAPQKVLDDFFNQITAVDRARNALPANGAVDIAGITITADAPTFRPPAKSNLPIFLVLGGLGLVAVVGVVMASRS